MHTSSGAPSCEPKEIPLLVYAIKRLLAMIPVLLVVAVLVFGLVHFTPGDPAIVMLGDHATEAEIAQLRTAMGFDRPIHVQFVEWVGGLVRGDFGDSFYLNRPVLQAIAERAEPTLMLTLLALTIAVSIGVPAGIISAIKRNSAVDQAFAVFALLGVSMPNFWLGLLLILFFGVQLEWFPVAGYRPIAEGFRSHLEYLALPAIVLGFSQSALISRVTRSTMLDVLHQDFVRTARSKGLMEQRVVIKHALKNAFIPILTVIGLALGAMLSGAIVIETVFALPGLGRLVVNSAARRDYPVIQGVVIVIAGMYVTINLLIDLTYALVDRRVRY